MGSPSEPLATGLLSFLSWKVAFLVAIFLARRVLEIRAFISEPPYTLFFKDKVQLPPHSSFFLKVVSQVYSNQAIFLPVFDTKPHANRQEQCLQTLDVRCALACYGDRTKPFCKSTQLFIAVADRRMVSSLLREFGLV